MQLYTCTSLNGNDCIVLSLITQSLSTLFTDPTYVQNYLVIVLLANVLVALLHIKKLNQIFKIKGLS